MQAGIAWYQHLRGILSMMNHYLEVTNFMFVRLLLGKNFGEIACSRTIGDPVWSGGHRRRYAKTFDTLYNLNSMFFPQ